MAKLLSVNPTRGTLLQLKEDVERITKHHDLLDRKREVLIHELMDRLEKAKNLEKEMNGLFKEAHRKLQTARTRIGSERIDWISLSPTVRYKMDINIGTIMGLRIPSIDLDIQPINPPYGLSDTSAALDETRETWMKVLQFIADGSDTFTSVWRLAMELRKTQRQVNALETTIIPRYRNTIDFIKEKLEEEEREDIVHAKKIKEGG